jgi:hypothetical protein
MAFVIADRVRETSTTIGTGNFTLAGAVDRFRTFDSVLDTGDTTYYTIADQSGVGWEVGIATFTSPSTLARTTILSSSNGGSAVDFGAGSKDVFITLPASRTVISFSGGSTGLTPSTASYGAISLGGTLVVGNGGTGTTTAFTAGSVVFAGASGVYSQDNSNLFWDDTNNRLGVGTTSPGSSIETTGAVAAASVKLKSTGGGSVTLTTPSTATDYTATFPANTGNVVTTGSSAVVTQAMLGTNVAGNGPAFSAYLSADQTITSSTFTKVQLNAELFDTNSNFDTATNYRFTPTVAGYYQINFIMSAFDSTSPTRCLSVLYKNGSAYTYGSDYSATAGIGTSVGSAVVYMNGSTDYLELYAFITATTAVISTVGSSSVYTNMSGALVRAA